MQLMNPVIIVLLVSSAIIAILNVFACYRVMKSEQLEPQQKILQYILIWAIPLCGAGLCIALTREPKVDPSPRRSSEKTFTDPMNVDPAVGDGSGDFFNN